MELPPLDFAFDYLTRSGRLDMDRLREIAPAFMARYEAERGTDDAGLTDPVSDDVPGAVEVGFVKSAHPNCSTILWDNLARNPDKLAVIGPASTMTYGATRLLPPALSGVTESPSFSTIPRSIRQHSSARCVPVSFRCY